MKEACRCHKEKEKTHFCAWINNWCTPMSSFMMSNESIHAHKLVKALNCQQELKLEIVVATLVS